MDINLASGIFLVLLLLAFAVTVVFPLYIKYVRHRNFDLLIAKREEDSLATQNILDTLISTHAYLFYDVDGKLRFGKRFFEEFAIKERLVSIPSVLRCIRLEDREKVKSAFETVDEKGVELYVRTTPFSSTKTHYLMLFLQRINLRSKKVTFGLFYFIDHIQDQQEKMREALRREEEANLKTSFLASMGHEIRTPLNSIVGFSRMLVENQKNLSEEEFKVIKDTISQSNKQLLDILDNVMKFTVNTDEKIDLPLTPKSVEALMTELYNMHTVIVPKEIQFNYVQGDSSDVVLTNRSSLLQIVSNLMNNAIKFTPEGSITLGWESNEDTITVFVQDTGIGIAHENLDKIFDKYFKQSSMMAGAGIGLSLCKRLTESMNGTISVESEVDKGSRFSVQLPRYSR